MLKITMYLLATLLSVTVLSSGVFAKGSSAEIEAELQALKEGQEQIQEELEEIKKLLKQGARAAPGQNVFNPTDIELGEVAYLGQENAVVTLVEVSDYHCPYCKRHADTVMKQLSESYIDTGKLRFVMREFPIPNLHPRAEAASTAALCAGEQGNYWGMHDALFADQKSRTDEAFQSMAAGLGLDQNRFDDCLVSDRFKAQIKADKTQGQKLGITGTPSFVVGLTDPENPDKVHLTRFIRGAQSFEAFSAAIDELLEESQAAD
jgi:protein-disulfide isomerase